MQVKAFLNGALAERQSPRPVGAKLSKAAAALAHLETVEKDHGRLETRRYYQSDQLGWFADCGKWEGLRPVGMVESIREIEGKATLERGYYLSSLPLGLPASHRGV